MKKMNQIYQSVLLLCLLVLSAEATAQEITKPMVDVLFNQSNGSFLRIFREGDPYQGTYFIEKEGVRKIQLPKGEIPLNYFGKSLWTYSLFVEAEDLGSTTFKVYDFFNDKLTLKESKTFNLIDLPRQLVNGGKNVVLSDFNMDFGANFVFFDHQFKHLSTYTPFLTGCDFSVFDSNEKKTAIVAKESSKNNYKLAIFDDTGHLVSESTFSLGFQYRPDELYFFNKYVIIYGLEVTQDKKLIPKICCIDENGILKWSKTIKITRIIRDIIGSSDKVFIISPTNNEIRYNENIFYEIRAFDLISGDSINNLQFKYIHNFRKNESEGISKENMPFYFRIIDNNNILILIGQCNIINSNYGEHWANTYFNLMLYKINDRFEVTPVSTIIPETGYFKVFKYLNFIKIVSKTKIYTYEIDK